MAVTFSWPTDTRRITSGYGQRWGRLHSGTDIADSGYHEVFATADGTVTTSVHSNSYGEYIILEHEVDGIIWESLYAHMRSRSRRVFKGDRVRQGQTIGVMGNTGNSTGQHLHFELHRGRWNSQRSNSVNPTDYLEKEISIDYYATGDLGPAIGNLQSLLNKLGFYHGAIDNSFGPLTEQAVRDFQQDQNITVDGYVGPITQARLTTAIKTYPLPDGVYNRWRHGRQQLDAVKQIQRALNAANFRVGTVDGYYGPKTEDAIRRFQSMYSDLKVDGVYGPNTKAKLDEEVND
ncbi:peptidoglycan-binding protein [Aquibacillus sediminis]|uniref:peptidoglycan-binding protein n=1 Tax=Aquibacillus sediminis TaxID=2574734 RepID=UPI001108D548|nr:peptidoglycan-binding protein [Aquibacillus sediminis]